MIINADVLDGLASLPDSSVQCVVTSPPYWRLRDYGVPGQLGLEKTPEEYVSKMVAVFREVRRVLRPDGTLWLNMGDSYASKQPRIAYGDQGSRGPGATEGDRSIIRDWSAGGLEEKQLVGLPWRLAFALQADGWWLRCDIIWSKPNPMPESVTDRPTKAHEYVFLLTKSARYYYDKEAVQEPWADHRNGDPGRAVTAIRDGRAAGIRRYDHETAPRATGRNLRSVWSIATQPFPDAHFATFPEKLVEPCVKAGTSEKGCCATCGVGWVRVVEKTRSFESGSGRSGNLPSGKNGPALQGGGETLDIRRGPVVTSTTLDWTPGCAHAGEPVPCLVLDPFAGSGTVGVVCLNLHRKFIGIELSLPYCVMARRRITARAPLLASVGI